MAGVTSFVRALGLRSRCYGCLLDFFHSPALCPDRLARVWTRLVLKVHPGIERSNGRLVVLSDGLKKGKCGRKMPAVKLLHQSGESNTKPSFIMGHSCQALALLARVGRFHHAVPLCARITRAWCLATEIGAPFSINSCFCSQAWSCPSPCS
jgi:hypothetical protein